MSSMGSMDSIFGSSDNSSVDDLLDIQNSVAFLSRVFGKISVQASTDGHQKLSARLRPSTANKRIKNNLRRPKFDDGRTQDGAKVERYGLEFDPV